MHQCHSNYPVLKWKHKKLFYNTVLREVSIHLRQFRGTLRIFSVPDSQRMLHCYRKIQETLLPVCVLLFYNESPKQILSHLCLRILLLTLESSIVYLKCQKVCMGLFTLRDAGNQKRKTAIYLSLILCCGHCQKDRRRRERNRKGKQINKRSFQRAKY